MTKPSLNDEGSGLSLCAAGVGLSNRRRLSTTRPSITHKFSVDGHEGYVTVGFFDDGTPGEMFIKMAKQGSVIRGLMDTIGILTSLSLQYGVPLRSIVEKLENVRFEPSGWTSNPELRQTTSLVDYIFRWILIAANPREELPQDANDETSGDTEQEDESPIS